MVEQKYQIRLFERISVGRDNECWPAHKVDETGYGKIGLLHHGVNYTMTLARLAYLVHEGLDPEDIADMQVCHTCNNRACGNPNHLYLCTQSDNMRDMVLAGRGRDQKISRELIEEVRRLFATGNWSKLDLAYRFDVSDGLIGKMILTETIFDKEQ